MPTACPAFSVAPSAAKTRPCSCSSDSRCRKLIPAVSMITPGAPAHTNSTAYTASDPVTNGPFQIVMSMTPNAVAAAPASATGRQRCPRAASTAPPATAPTACTPLSRPISVAPPCSRRATNTMNSTTKIPWATSAMNATSSAPATARQRRTTRSPPEDSRSPSPARPPARPALRGSRAMSAAATPKLSASTTTIARRLPAASSRPPSGPPASRPRADPSPASEFAGTRCPGSTRAGSSAFLAGSNSAERLDCATITA
jgi:hypothetical protein